MHQSAARSRFLRLVVVPALFATTACAEIRRFTVTPHEICPGTSVKTEWDVTGTPTVTTSPEVKPQGDRTYRPTTDTQFVLTVKALFSQKTAPANAVTVYTGTAAAPAEMGQLFVFRAKCAGGSVVAEDTLVAADWDSRLSIATITSIEDRNITIEHEGKRAVFTAQAPTSSALAGTRMVGHWRITVPLRPGESCNGAAPPGDLRQIALKPSLYCGS